MTRPRRTIPHLFAHWDRVAERIRASRRVVLFFDFDGTLVRIAPMPDLVRFAVGLRRVLRKLARNPRATLVVISGRRRAELQGHIGIRRMKYLGLYGWEGHAGAKLASPEQAALFRAYADLLVEVAAHPPVWIEPKCNSFAIHLQGASAKIQRRVLRRVRTRLKPLHGTLRVMRNHRDMEVVPASVEDKGVAVRKFLSTPALRGALPIYFGDDLSDEPAFAALGEGISILVGRPRPTRARFHLRGPAEVAKTLVRVEAVLRWRSRKHHSRSARYPT